jgi:hypothetical protein
MQPETKFLRLRTPVTVGSLFGDWVVTWDGGWTRDIYIVMVAKIERKETASETGSVTGVGQFPGSGASDELIPQLRDQIGK